MAPVVVDRRAVDQHRITPLFRLISRAGSTHEVYTYKRQVAISYYGGILWMRLWYHTGREAQVLPSVLHLGRCSRAGLDALWRPGL